jgi:hypothetical protein
MTTLYDIDKFCDYFEAQVHAIDNLEPHPVTEESVTQVRLYKKTLIISAIDTLSSLRFLQNNYKELNKQKKARFIRFVAEYSEWENGALISVPYLLDQLTTKNLKASKLYDALYDSLLMHNENAGKAQNIEVIDIKAEELLNLSNSESEEHLIHESQHYSLLYGYKNCIAHEDGDHCGVLEAYQYAQPHYYSYIEDRAPNGLTQWYLSYPVEHFKNLFFCSMKNMRWHFIKTNTNPYTLIGDGRGHSRWW